jgi:hypothetical protein
MATEYKPGDIVDNSGIYKVVHDRYHAGEHDVTCVHGKKFPPCNHCGHNVRFILKYAAIHIDSSEHFR